MLKENDIEKEHELERIKEEEERIARFKIHEKEENERRLIKNEGFDPGNKVIMEADPAEEEDDGNAPEKDKKNQKKERKAKGKGGEVRNHF